MKKIRKQEIINFSILLFLFILFTLFLISFHGYKQGIQIAFLAWSFYILCVPAKHGRFLIGLPYKIITGKNLLHQELFIWIGALTLNIFTFFVLPLSYFKQTFTHLLYRIISTPWPYWLIIFTAALSTLYPSLIAKQKVTIQTPKHFFIRKFLSLIAIVTLIYLTFKDFVILLNMHA